MRDALLALFAAALAKLVHVAQSLHVIAAMNFLMPARKSARAAPPAPATALRVQSSANGVARPIVYGQARISGNLLWYGDFVAQGVYSQPASGGKGGGGGGGGAQLTGYNYFASAAFGLCEGPITGIIQGWENKSAFALGQGTAMKTTAAYSDPDGAFTLLDGSYQQLPWAWLASYQPQDAQNFRGIAYEAAQGLSLGGSAELPNMTFEVRSAITGAVAEAVAVPASGPTTVQAQYFDWDYGVCSHLVIPAATPYQIDNSTSVPDPTSISGLASSIASNESGWFTSDSSGVVWDAGATGGRTPGTALTRVGGAPSAGEYSYAGNTGWTFAAADAGQPVVVIGAALSPGVFYTDLTTGTISSGSAVVTGLGSMTGVSPGARVAGSGIPPFTFVQALSGGSATGTVSSGSAVVAGVTGAFSAAPGTPIADSAGAFPGGTTVLSVTAPSIAVSVAAAVTATGDTIYVTASFTADLQGNELQNCSPATPPAGAQITNPDYGFGPFTVASVSGTTATLTEDSGVYGLIGFPWEMQAQITGDVAAGSGTIANPSSLAGIVTGGTVADAAGAWSWVGAPTVSSVTPGALTLSHTAGSNVAADVVTFASEVTLSQPANASGTVDLSFIGGPLAQVLSGPAAGQFALDVSGPTTFGTYTFAAADAGRTVLILDTPDANPADVLADFLTNPFYGLTQFPAARLGDLSTYRDYCQAAGLFVSPVISSQSAANSFLADLMTATNSEIVWSGGLLTVVPYGDQALAANGASYAPPAQPLYDLDDDDFLENQGTNPNSSSAAGSPDPVTVTRLIRADQENDIKLEFLDRGAQYNPQIVEAKDDAAIAQFGLKSSGSKQLHLFCDQKSALASAQLMLGRQQVLRTVSFTLGSEYILLDPMDIVALWDANAGLAGDWFRIKEITENDDRSLSIVAEEYLDGTGAAPLYPHAHGAGHVPNYNLPAADALAPIFFDAPVQIGNVLGMETIICTNGSGPNWGGCDIWISQDDVTFRYAGTLIGGTAMGTLTANFASGSDPDTANTLSVDLTSSRGGLLPGTQADADQGNTLCLVDGELVTYEQSTLTAQWKYDLGKHATAPGYLRRGFYGTPVAGHAAGAKFARLREGSYFTVGYDSADIGQTIYVKLLSFNQHGGGKQTLDQVASHSHTLAAPPASSSGLLPGIIQTPDVALNAATEAAQASALNGSATIGSPVTLVSVGITTSGALVMIAANGLVGMPGGGGGNTVSWRVTRDGTVIWNNGSASVGATGVAVPTVQINDTGVPPGAHTYALQAEQSTGSGIWQWNADITATEIKL